MPARTATSTDAESRGLISIRYAMPAASRRNSTSVALQVDCPHERFGLTPDVGRNGYALAQDRVPAQRRAGALGPLREARVHLAIGIQETHGLAPAGQQLLHQGGLPETGHRLDGEPCLSGGDDELGTQ